MLSERRRHARALFAPLGPTYDRVGAVLSFGQDPRWRRFLVSRLPSGGGRVLDVATGTGLVAAALLERGFEVTGLDQSPDMLDLAQRRFAGRVELVEGSADDLPFPDASFDHLTFTYLLRYVDDPAATMRELARVVRPGGTIAMLEFGLPRRDLETTLGRVGRRRPSTRGPGDLARLARGRALPRPVDPPVPRGVPCAGARACSGATPGSRTSGSAASAWAGESSSGGSGRPASSGIVRRRLGARGGREAVLAGRATKQRGGSHDEPRDGSGER